MNLMYAALNNVMSKNPKINVKIKQLQQKIKDEHIKFTDNFKKMRGLIYFDEGLPIIGKCRDVLKKPEDICTLHMSFDRKEDLSKVSVEDALNIKRPQLPDLTLMQKNIVSTFPYDLWQMREKGEHNDKCDNANL